MQRKIIRGIRAVVFLFCVFCLSAEIMPVYANEIEAEEQWHSVSTDDGMIEISLPEEWMVFTKETVPDEELFEEVGVDPEWLLKDIDAVDTGMIALSVKGKGVIMLYRDPANSIPDLSSLTEEELDVVIDSLKTAAENQGGEIQTEYRYLYKGKTEPYFFYERYDLDTEELLSSTYQTIVGKEKVMISFEGTVGSADNHEFQEKVIDGITYNAPEYTLEDVERDMDASMTRVFGRSVSALVICIIIGAVISCIIVACVNFGKKSKNKDGQV